MVISVICVSNRKDQLERQFLYSLKRQRCEYELIIIDNNEHHFASAASALNYGVEQSSGNVLVFSHQDIWLKTERELELFADEIDKLDVGDIVGTQGVVEKSKVYYSNLTAGEELNPDIITVYPLERINVSCIDEGFFGMKRETWERHHFDEALCDNWHLYAVESCLNARKNGHSVYVFPIQLHHFSYGTISSSYMDGLKELCEYYRKDFKYVWTTCYKVYTFKPYITTLVWIWNLNRKIRGKKK